MKSSSTGYVKFVSLFVIVAMIFSVVGFSGLAVAKTGQATAPENTETEESLQPVLRITEIVADTPVIYLDMNNRLTITIANEGEAMALKATAKIFDIVPEQSEELLTTLHLGAIRPGMERSRFVDWTPAVLGIHYIKVEMNYEYLTHNSPAEMVEAPPTVMSAGFPVSPQATIQLTWGPGGWPIYDDNNTINLITDPTGIREISGTSSDPVEITVYEGFSIEDPCTLKLNEYVTFIIDNPNHPGEYGINIEKGGKFIINSPTNPTTIQPTFDEYPPYTYDFHNNGSIDFVGADVTYVFGNRNDLSQPAGIINYPNSFCNLTDCHVELADTHSIVANNSALNIRGAECFIGKADSNSNSNNGTGIKLENTNGCRFTDNMTVQYCEQSGIVLKNCINTRFDFVSVISSSGIETGGVLLDDCDGIFMTNSTLYKNNHNAMTISGGNHTISETLVESNINGLVIQNNANVNITGCAFIYNTPNSAPHTGGSFIEPPGVEQAYTLMIHILN